MTRLSTVDEQRARLARRVSQFAVSGASGFTLVELLVTIVILGVLSGVVIFAVGGMQSQSRTSACAADRTALETAMESYRAINGAYGTEAQLVAAGQLRSESTMYDIALGSNGDFTLLPVGPCAGDELVAAASDPSAAHVSPPSTPTSTAPPSTTTTTAPPATTTTTRCAPGSDPGECVHGSFALAERAGLADQEPESRGSALHARRGQRDEPCGPSRRRRRQPRDHDLVSPRRRPRQEHCDPRRHRAPTVEEQHQPTLLTADHRSMSTGVPSGSSVASWVTPALLMRMQPWLTS